MEASPQARRAALSRRERERQYMNRKLTLSGNRNAGARRLREQQTAAETKLWDWLRSRRFQGHKFRRQFAVGPYFTDFCCIQRRLIIELDGYQHLRMRDDDANRTAYLNQRGFRVMRFWNTDMEKN